VHFHYAINHQPAQSISGILIANKREAVCPQPMLFADKPAQSISGILIANKREAVCPQPMLFADKPGTDDLRDLDCK
jgi:hypothetical protein